MPRNDTRRPLVLGKISQPRIGDYLKKRDEYINLPARIDRHGIKILYKGKWLTKPELDAVFKRFQQEIPFITKCGWDELHYKRCNIF